MSKKYRRFHTIGSHNDFIHCSHSLSKTKKKTRASCYLFEIMNKDQDMRCTYCNEIYNASYYLDKTVFIELERVIFII